MEKQKNVLLGGAMRLKTLKNIRKKPGNMPSPRKPTTPGISASYREITDEDRASLLLAFEACGVAGYNEFFRECVKTFLAQTRDQNILIAWPPEFLVQDRSNKELVRLRWAAAKDRRHSDK
jgi:hypothetical protein